MDRHEARDLEILTAIGEGRPLSQRALAERLGIALGLVNLYVRRLSRKGYVKITEFSSKPAARKRLRYLLTPKGVAAKTRLTWDHMAYSLKLYRRARETLRDALGLLPENRLKRIALYGTGEAAELAYLTLRDFGLDPVALYAREAGGRFLGFTVQPARDAAADDVEAVVVATFEDPEPEIAELVRVGVPRSKILTLRGTAAANGHRAAD
jgi:DNA-binding MarR family transcriptional regulator